MPGTLQIPSTVLVGGGVRHELAAQVERLAARRALFVTDPGVVALGYVEPLLQALRDSGVTCEVFDGVQPDPTVNNCLAGLEKLRQLDAEVIVAVGGGSPIDAAKAISILAQNPSPLSLYQGYHRVSRAGVPVIAIPTTAGTGSEATRVAVITDEERGVKMMMLDAHLVPRVALVDYELSLSMPPALTAAVGIDTLTHGIEAFVSAKAHPLTDPLALSCVRLTGEHLLAAFKRPDYHEAREGMMLAACHGGMAFANSSVCLVHGMSRPLGAAFHIAHGLSNALLLPTITEFSISAAIPRYATCARTLGWADDDTSDREACLALTRGLTLLNATLGIPKLRDVAGVSESEFEKLLPKLAADALASGSPQNNPRVPTVEEIIELYRRVW